MIQQEVFNGPPPGTVLANAIPLTNYEVAALTEAKLTDMETRERDPDNNIIQLNTAVQMYANTLSTRQGLEVERDRIDSIPLRFDGAEDQRGCLTAFEVTTILNLLPTTRDQAVSLLPTLAQYHAEDLQQLLSKLQA